MNGSLTRLTLFSALFAGAVLLVAADVKTDYDHAADFGRYKTYSWMKVEAGNPLWTDRITQAVDQELSSKGWRKVASDGDARVSAFGAAKNQKTLETFYDGFGGGWGWRGFGRDGMATTSVVNTPVGSLTVDIFDASSKKLIWRGTSMETLSEKPEKNEKKLNSSVQDMFKHFPPASKG
jgi:hypothetical protein